MAESSHKLVAVVVLTALCLVAGVTSAAARTTRPTLTFRVFVRTAPNMVSIVWTGTQFLYVENTANTVWAAPAAGLPIRQFATMPRLLEETRCVQSTGTHGFPPGVIFCHSPDNKIYEISGDGSSVSTFATLPAPYPPASDGALIFDTVGRFGYRLVAATGRSGAAEPAGGVVYTIDPSGAVQEIGSYPGPGGADQVAIAPAGFGSVAGQALLTVDPGPTQGALVAMDANGATRTVASLPDGPDPIAAIPTMSMTKGTPAPGLYVTDDTTGYTYLAPASELAPFAGDVIVGTEVKARFWIVEPRGKSFVTIPVRHNLRGGHYSLEAALYVG